MSLSLLIITACVGVSKMKMKILNFVEKWPVSLMPLITLLAVPFVVYGQPPSLPTKAAVSAPSASFLLSPSRGTVALGEVFEVSILLSTGGAGVDGADAILRYNPRMLKAVALENGGLFEERLQKRIDEVAGEIRLSEMTFDSRPKMGTFGVVSFETLQKGTTSVFFDFLPGATRDSNVALTSSGGVDLLKEVGNAQYVIE